MAKYYVQYTIYNWDDDETVPENFTAIGGVSVRSQFSSTSFYNGDSSGPIGFNHVRLVGITPASEDIPFGEFGFSYDDVGTTYYSYRSIDIPDGNFIDPDYLIGSSDDSDSSDGMDLLSGWLANSGTAETSWGDFSVSLQPGLGLRKAFDYVVDHAAQAVSPYFADVIDTVDKVNSVKTALNSVMEDSFELLNDGITNFETMSARDFSERADTLLRDSNQTFLNELGNQIGSNPPAIELLRSVNVISGGERPSDPVSVTVDTNAPAGGGVAILGVDVREYKGSSGRDVVIQTAAPDGMGHNLNRIYELGAGNDKFAGSDNGGEIAFGQAGNDDLFMGGGIDLAFGGLGNDTLFGGAGDDELHAGDGSDTLNGGEGDDFLFGGDSAADLRDLMLAGDGNDNVDAGAGNDDVFGEGGNDTMQGGAGADTLRGQDGDDVITGSNFSDAVFGNAGADFINGGFGHDRVNGGTGADRFYHIGQAGHGSDWIQDYAAAQGDVLLFGGAAQRSQFQVNYADTANAGAAGVAEAFVIYRPTGQILWALVDGAAQGSIDLQVGAQVFDLM